MEGGRGGGEDKSLKIFSSRKKKVKMMKCSG